MRNPSDIHLVLAAGHSLFVSGAVYGDEVEALDAIIQVDECARLLRGAGFHVTVVPHELDYRETVAYINRLDDVDLCLEIHKNAGSKTARRIEVYYELGNTPVASAASRLAALLAVEGKMRSISLPDTRTHVGRLHFCRATQFPALLLEMGFIEEVADEKWYGRILAYSLMKYFGVAQTAPKVQRKNRRLLQMRQRGEHKYLIDPSDEKVIIRNPYKTDEITVVRTLFDGDTGNPVPGWNEEPVKIKPGCCWAMALGGKYGELRLFSHATYASRVV